MTKYKCFYATSWEKQNISKSANEFMKKDIDEYAKEYQWVADRYGRQDPWINQRGLTYNAACYIVRDQMRQLDPMININDAKQVVNGQLIRDTMYDMEIPEPLIPSPMWAELFAAVLVPSWLFRNKQYAAQDMIDVTFTDPIYFEEDDRKAIIGGEVCHYDTTMNRTHKGWKIYNTMYIEWSYKYHIAMPDWFSKKNRYMAVSKNGIVIDGWNLGDIKNNINAYLNHGA